MKLHKVPETLVPKLPLGKIIKYINKKDETLTPKTGIIIKNDTNMVLKAIKSNMVWSIKAKDNVFYVAHDILKSIRKKL